MMMRCGALANGAGPIGKTAGRRGCGGSGQWCWSDWSDHWEEGVVWALMNDGPLMNCCCSLEVIGTVVNGPVVNCSGEENCR